METTNDLLARMEQTYRELSGHSARQVSDTGLRLRVLAAELVRLQAEVAWLRRQAFPETAAGEWLDRHAQTRGLTRREAVKAEGSLTFSRYLPLSFDLVIPAGTLCASSGEDPVEVETTRDGVLEAGALTLTVPARAVAAGPRGNLSAGTVNTLVDAPEGIHYVNNGAPFAGGRAAETDEELRPRVLEAYRLLPTATGAAFYRDLALSVEGVGSVGVAPRVNGAGTVGVYVWGTEGAPSQEVLDQVQSTLDEARELAATVTVAAAASLTKNVDVRVKLGPGADPDRAVEEITAALRAWFAGRQVGSSAYLSELARVVLNAAPVVKLEWPVTMSDTAALASRIPLLGTVNVEVLS